MTGWDEHGHARPTGLPIDRYLRSGDLQDAENCGYEPVSVLAEIGIDRAYGRPQTQYRNGRIVCADGTVLERGGTLGCVWAVTQLPTPATPTADVPTEDRTTDLRTPARWLNAPEFAGIEILDYDGWRGADWRTPVTVQEFRRRLWLCTITGPVRRSPHRSGVAGEPEATTKEASESAQDSGPTPTHAPTPETPGASTTAGGVTVPDEAVEAYRAGYGRSFREENRTDRDDVRAGLAAAAPLIVEHYLRTRIREHEVPPPLGEEALARISRWAVNGAIRSLIVDALRAVADIVEAEAERLRGAPFREGVVGIEFVNGLESAAGTIRGRADELRRRPVDMESRADELERGGEHV